MVALRQAMGWFLNVILPGSGLIIRRREWLGLALAVVFGLCGNVALAGWLIAPAAIPGQLTILAAVLASLTWFAAQILLWRQGLEAARCANDLSVVLREAHLALERGDLDTAAMCLETGLAVDQESPELHILHARLLALQGNDHAAPKAHHLEAEIDIHNKVS